MAKKSKRKSKSKRRGRRPARRPARRSTRTAVETFCVRSAEGAPWCFPTLAKAKAAARDFELTINHPYVHVYAGRIPWPRDGQKPKRTVYLTR